MRYSHGEFKRWETNPAAEHPERSWVTIESYDKGVVKGRFAAAVEPTKGGKEVEIKEGVFEVKPRVSGPVVGVREAKRDKLDAEQPEAEPKPTLAHPVP